MTRTDPGRAPHAPREESGSAATGAVALAAAFALTVFDAVATHIWLAAGIAVEGNPLLASLMETVGEVSALSLRVAVGGSLLLLLWALTPRSRLARGGLYGLVAVLGSVAIWHLQGVSHLAGS